MAGSEQYTNWEGIQYDQVIAAIRADPAITPQQVSDKIAQTALGDSITYSSVALDARMTTLKTAVDQWAIALKNGLPTYKSAYASAWRNTLNFTDATEKDLYDAAYQIKAKVADATIKARCDAVMAAVTGAVTVNWTNGSNKVAKAKGIAIWYPSTAKSAEGHRERRLRLLPGERGAGAADELGRVPGRVLQVRRSDRGPRPAWRRDAAPLCALLHSQGSWEQCAQDLDPEGKRRQTGALLPPRAVHSSN